MDKKTEESIQQTSQQNVLPPVDPRLMAAMYGMPAEDEIDLLEYWRVLWGSRKLILAVTLAAAVLAAGISLLMPNIYRAEVLLAPVSDDAGKGGGLSAALGGLGGLASLAGMSLPGGGNIEESLAVLKSREFLWRFVKDEKLMPVLFEDDWDEEKKSWKDADPEKQPTLWSAYRKLTKGVLNIDQDKKSNLVTLSIEWKDPELAAKWANSLVERLNAFLRQRAIEESKASLKYLNEALQKTQLEDVRKALFELISQEQKKAMLANTRVQYAFKVLDSAQAPDKKARPKRSLIVILAAFVAGFLVMVFVFIRHGVEQRRQLEGKGE